MPPPYFTYKLLGTVGTGGEPDSLQDWSYLVNFEVLEGQALQSMA